MGEITGFSPLTLFRQALIFDSENEFFFLN